MTKIKGVSTIKWKCCDKKRIVDKYRKAKDEKVQECEEKETKKEVSCFALVPVIKLPWYRRLFKSIRNFIVIYKWRKAR